MKQQAPDKVRLFLVKLHNLRAEFLKRLNNHTQLAVHDDLEHAEVGYKKDIRWLEELERTQRDEERLVPGLRDYVEQELRTENDLADSLARFVKKHDKHEEQQVLVQRIMALMQRLQKQYEQEERAASEFLRT
jgi:hypothetical protein